MSQKIDLIGLGAKGEVIATHLLEKNFMLVFMILFRSVARKWKYLV